MAEPGRQFRDDHQFKGRPPATPGDLPVPGRGTLVTNGPTTLEGLVAQQLRSAIGALTQLKTTWIPQLDAATAAQQAADGIAVINARSALLRAEQALAQAGGLRTKVTSPELDELWQTATAEREAVAPRVLELFVAQDNLPIAPTMLGDTARVSADPAPPAPVLAPAPAPKQAAPAPSPAPQPSAVIAAPAYAPSWETIQKAAAGDAAAVAALDVSWIDGCHRLVIAGIDQAFSKAATNKAFGDEAARDTKLQKLGTDHGAAARKVITDELAARKADKANPASKDDLKEANIKKDPAVIKKQQELETKYADDKARRLAELRATFDARKHSHGTTRISEDVAAPPKDGVDNAEGQLLARANFMAWGIHVLGSAAAVKAHFGPSGMVEVLKLSSANDPLLMAKAAADRLVAACTAFEQQFPGNTFFHTDVGFGLRNAHNEKHRLSYLGHALGYSVDFQAVANPSFLDHNNGRKDDHDGPVAMFMIKKFGGTTVNGKHVDPATHMEMPNDTYKEVQAMGRATAGGQPITARGQQILDATVSYDAMTATSDRFRASQASNMKELGEAKQAWIDAEGSLKHALAEKKTKVEIARKAAAKKLAGDAEFKKLPKPEQAAKIDADSDVVSAAKERQDLETKIDEAHDKAQATVTKVFGPWVKQIQDEIVELEKPLADADQPLAADVDNLKAAIGAVTAATKRDQLVKVLEHKKYGPLFDAAAIGKIADVEPMREAMLQRLTTLRSHNPKWNQGELATRKRLVERLSGSREVFGNVKDGKKWDNGKWVPTWHAEAYVNGPPVMQLLEIGFARHDELGDATKDKGLLQHPKQVFNREFIQTMMRFGFAPLATSDAFLDTMHFDFLDGFAATPSGSFFAGGNFGPKSG